jgi:glyoxylase-like metal-dependent hydrolase (beta-lactamase superfamily II)
MMIKKVDDIGVIQLSDIDSNIYFIGDAVIDTGTGFNFVRLFDFMKRLKIDPDKVKWVINTHYHFDHIGGNGYFPNAKIAIHEADAAALEKGDAQKTNAAFFNGKIHPMKVEKKLKEGDVIVGLKVIHTPGHTPGSICLYDEKRKILFSGDTIFSDGVGRTDMPGGNEDHLGKSLEKLSKIDVKKMLPGHGELVLENAKKIIAEICGG